MLGRLLASRYHHNRTLLRSSTTYQAATALLVVTTPVAFKDRSKSTDTPIRSNKVFRKPFQTKKRIHANSNRPSVKLISITIFRTGLFEMMFVAHLRKATCSIDLSILEHVKSSRPLRASLLGSRILFVREGRSL